MTNKPDTIHLPDSAFEGFGDHCNVFGTEPVCVGDPSTTYVREDLYKALQAENELLKVKMGESDAGLESRMSSMGMVPSSGLLSTPPTPFSVHAAVTDLEAFEWWISSNHESFLKMRMRYETGQIEKDDLYEWLFAHASVFGSVCDNFRAAKAKLDAQPAVTDCDVDVRMEGVYPGSVIERTTCDVQGFSEGTGGAGGVGSTTKKESVDPAVTVKPLEWTTYDKYSSAASGYRVLKAPFETNWRLFFGDSYVAHDECQDILKQTAQVDYERRILSAINQQGGDQ